MNLLQDQDETIRDSATRAVGALGPAAREAAAMLVAALRDSTRRFDYNAAEALCRMGPEGLALLLPLLRDESADLRACDPCVH